LTHENWSGSQGGKEGYRKTVSIAARRTEKNSVTDGTVKASHTRGRIRSLKRITTIGNHLKNKGGKRIAVDRDRSGFDNWLRMRRQGEGKKKKSGWLNVLTLRRIGSRRREARPVAKGRAWSPKFPVKKEDEGGGGDLQKPNGGLSTKMVFII